MLSRHRPSSQLATPRAGPAWLWPVTDKRAGSSTRSSSWNASNIVAGEASHRTLPPAQPRNPWHTVSGIASSGTFIQIATSTSGVTSRQLWVDSRTPSSIEAEIASLRVHSPRSPPTHTASCVPLEAHRTLRPPTHRPNGLCPIVPRSSSGTLAPRLVSIASTVLADKPPSPAAPPILPAPLPSLHSRLCPFKYNHGNAARSSLFVFLTYAGTNAERNVTASPVFARTFGIFTVTGSHSRLNLARRQIAITNHSSPAIA